MSKPLVRQNSNGSRPFSSCPVGKIPSHDTFTRVFARLVPDQFQTCFVRWIAAVSQRMGGQVIAIDGKVLRRSHDHGIGQAAIDMVSAWATANHLVLGQVKVTEKSNDITAIPGCLLPALAKWRAVASPLTLWAARPIIAQAIVEQDADYVLALKDNQGQSVRRCPIGCSTIWKAASTRPMRTTMPKPLKKGMAALRFASAGPYFRSCCALPPARLEEAGQLANRVTDSCPALDSANEKSCEDRCHIASLTGAPRVLKRGPIALGHRE